MKRAKVSHTQIKNVTKSGIISLYSAEMLWYFIFNSINSKHMASQTVPAAGNYIRTAPDVRSFLRFPRLCLVIIYDFVSTSVLCVMFLCKNNNTMCQKNTEPKLDSSGRSCYWRPLCESGSMTDPSVSVRFACLEAELSLMTTRFIGTLFLSHLWGQPDRVGEQGLLEFITCQGVGKALHSKGEGSDEQSD